MNKKNLKKNSINQKDLQNYTPFISANKKDCQYLKKNSINQKDLQNYTLFIRTIYRIMLYI